ncbi:MAG: hypothetical protein AAB668_01710 [Patescibacteria group bacterium]
MNGKKPAIMLLLVAILVVAFVQICKPMQMLCGSACFETGNVIAASAMSHAPDTGMGAPCSEGASSCSSSGDSLGHISAFSGVFPSVSTNVFTFLPLFASLILFALLLVTRDKSGSDPWRVRVASLERRLANVVGVDALRFALSQGILHPKLYA